MEEYQISDRSAVNTGSLSAKVDGCEACDMTIRILYFRSLSIKGLQKIVSMVSERVEVC